MAHFKFCTRLIDPKDFPNVWHPRVAHKLQVFDAWKTIHDFMSTGCLSRDYPNWRKDITDSAAFRCALPELNLPMDILDSQIRASAPSRTPEMAQTFSDYTRFIDEHLVLLSAAVGEVSPPGSSSWQNTLLRDFWGCIYEALKVYRDETSLDLTQERPIFWIGDCLHCLGANLRIMANPRFELDPPPRNFTRMGVILLEFMAVCVDWIRLAKEKPQGWEQMPRYMAFNFFRWDCDHRHNEESINERAAGAS